MVTTVQNHLGFLLPLSKICGNIFIPKYYNPEIQDRLNILSKDHQLITVGELIDEGFIEIKTGDEIGKMAYGTGEIPFIRTSDISNWEIKTDPKQGVSEDIYKKYNTKQDVKAGDIFLVRDGTYLIGQSCLVTSHDLPCLYQSHILKIRVLDSSPISAPLLLACLNSPIVKWQFKSKQFTADIIDTLGNRYREIVLPIPISELESNELANEVQQNIIERISLREKIRKIPFWVEGIIDNLSGSLPDTFPISETLENNLGFTIPYSSIKSGIFIPKYYDPQIDSDLKRLSLTHNLVSLDTLVKNETISWDTGIEIGKMAYNTGSIPFVRTSDITNWELKSDPKQGVGEEIYQKFKQDVEPDDIFIVRDGTYLVGTSCILTEHDTKILYCGGLYKIRVNKKETLDPYLLLALLNTQIVRRQMRAKQFTRDVIDTLGKRLFEIYLPIPKNKEIQIQVAKETREIIKRRVELRIRARDIACRIEGDDQLMNEELELIED